MIRVLLVDESALTLSILEEGLSALGDFEVIGTARDVRQAAESLQFLRPQVLCIGLELSKAVELTLEVMGKAPTPVLLLTNPASEPSQASMAQAREAGALDILSKPGSATDSSMTVLGSRLRILSGVKVFGRKSRLKAPLPHSKRVAPKLVAIGASTGGPQALGKLFRGLDAGFPWPVVCVQHMSPGFLDGMVAWLKTQTSLDVRVACGGERPRPGQVFFAPEDQHLRVSSDGTLELDGAEPVDGHRPSATVLLSSVAKVCGAAAIGILLTGMGADGAWGLLELAQAGALTLAQDEESSVVFGMPKQAVDIGAVKEVHSLDEIGALLRAQAKRRHV